MKKYDVIVIGAGAGVKVASPAAQMGYKVALVEKGPLGGTCLNRGCIPSKMLIHPADVATQIAEAKKFGLQVPTNYKIKWKELVKRVSETVDEESEGINPYVEKDPNRDWYREEAYFVEDKVLMVGGQKITAEKIFISAGTRPFIPPIEGLAGTPFMTSTEALRLTKKPKSIAIIGGGYIGCELGHFYGALGVETHILDRNATLLRAEDKDISEEFTRVFSKKYHTHLESTILSIHYKGKHFVTTYEMGGKKKTLKTEQLLVATGRTPNTDILQICNTSIKMNKRGFIEANDYMETNVPGIWAFGDIIGKYQFRHSANYEGETVFRNVFQNKKKEKMNYKAMPHAVFSHPQIAGVGKTEAQLQEEKIDYVVGKRKYIQSGMGMALLSDHGFVKILADRKTKKILGAHIVGHEASTLIHELIYAMRYDATTDDIINTIHIHPALSELIPKAIQNIDWKK